MRRTRPRSPPPSPPSRPPPWPPPCSPLPPQAGAIPHAVPSDPPWVTVASGLDNPRLLSFSGHALYVAEAGRGGAGPCVPGPEGEDVCFGLSGAITRVTHGGSERVVTGLPSLAAAGGGGALGPSDVVRPPATGTPRTIGPRRARSRRCGTTFGETGASLGHRGHRAPVRRHAAGGGRPRGVRGGGGPRRQRPRLEPDRDAPASGGPRSSPTPAATPSCACAPADASRTLAVFPNTLVPAPGPPPQAMMPMQAVPTSVVRGPDGAYYVSQLTGFPFPAGGSSIWRVVPGRGAHRLRHRAHERDRPGVVPRLAVRRAALRRGPAQRAHGRAADRLAGEGRAGCRTDRRSRRACRRRTASHCGTARRS